MAIWGISRLLLAWVALYAGENSKEDLSWAFSPPHPPQSRWFSRTSIDDLVIEKLRETGLEPSEPADRLTLLRRVTFDLTGLPPSPDEIRNFPADQRPDAYERVVDRLLASPRFGEKQARQWLDAARFSESDGFEYDRIRQRAWPYRDYVIRSFNDDKPYPQFIREQIAGDLIADATPETIAATGFLVSGPWDEANNIQASAVMRARTREDEVEDMVAVVGQTFLGLTVNCARCHDHKFDPIPQLDYYRMASALAGPRHGERPAVPPRVIAERVAAVDLLKTERQQVEAEISAIEARGRSRVEGNLVTSVPGKPSALARWSFDNDATDSEGTLHGTLEGGAKVEGGSLRLSGAGALLRAGPLTNPLREKTLEAWCRPTDPDQRGGAVLSVQIRGGSAFDAIVYGEREPRKWFAGSEGFVRTRDLDATAEFPGENTVHLAITYATDGRITVYRDGVPYGSSYRPPESPRTYNPAETEVLIGLRHTGAGNGFFVGEVEEARLYDRALSACEIALSFRAGPGGINRAEVIKHLTIEERANRDALLAQSAEIKHRIESQTPIPTVYAANPVKPGVTHLLLRGDVEKPGKAVTAGGVSKLPKSDFGLPSDAPEASRRLALAEWLARPDHPLTFRVMANRVWQGHFGSGIVGTPNDFGISGDPPSNSALLDLLALELRDSGGSLKRLHRKIVLSKTYRQGSQFRAEAAAKDAEARLLWRFPPRRLQAEEVRDAMLFASGTLNPKMGGPSFQPFDVKVFGSNLYTLKDPTGPEFERRTIYRVNVVSAKSPFLETFDCPDPGTKTPRRGVTVTPLQALSLMNDTSVQRYAANLAELARKTAGDDPAKTCDQIYLRALGRLPSDSERTRAARLAENQGWQDVAWAVFNSSEFVHVR